MAIQDRKKQTFLCPVLFFTPVSVRSAIPNDPDANFFRISSRLFRRGSAGRTSTCERCYKFKNSFEKIGEKNCVFLLKIHTVSFCKNVIITLVFEKNANFFAENWQKLQKIVIITSTHEEDPTRR
jgi:hypothetical protein